MATLRASAVLSFALVAGCHSGNPGQAEPKTGTRARIENRASLDMDVSVRRNDGVVSRLGFVPGDETVVFALPPTLTAGAAWVRFEARPAHASGQLVVSEPFPVTIGDEITWSVSPQ